MSEDEAIILATAYIQEKHLDQYATAKPVVMKEGSAEYLIRFDKVIHSRPAYGLVRVDKSTGHVDWVPLR